MDQTPGQGAEPGAGAPVPVCYRHPDRETGVRCARCERPVCPECMVDAAVGFQCPECVRGVGRSASAARPRTLAGGAVSGDPRLLTKLLIAVNLALFLAVHAGSSVYEHVVLIGGWPGPEQFPPGGYAPFEGVAAGDWYRLLSSAFAHEQPWHLAVNMLGLWWLGGPLESALGRLRYLGLYLVSGLAGSALTYLLSPPEQVSLGASGAVFGLLGATVVLLRRLREDLRPVLVLLALNLLFTFLVPNIAWQAHLGGLIAGAVVAYGIVHAPARHRSLVQAATLAAVLALALALVALRTVALV